jgi:uncharacterized protein
MPANLTPQYHKAEAEYRRAQTSEERIACLEKMLQVIPKHKGTDRLQGELRARLKEVREELQAEKSAPKTGKSFRIPRQGAGAVVLIGGPNSGKSRILAELTNAHPEVADYPFTTREPLPGMMPWEDVTVQLIDTPPVTESHIEPYLVGYVRSADVVLLCFNGASDDAPQETADVIEQFRSRKTVFSDQSGFDDDDFSIAHAKTLLTVTRGEDPDIDIRLELLQELVPHSLETIRVNLENREDVERLRNTIYRSLNVIRVYTKRPGKPADFKDPFTLPVGGTVEDLAEKVHRDLAAGLKFAKVWGGSARDGQSVSRDHPLSDRDVVELH